MVKGLAQTYFDQKEVNTVVRLSLNKPTKTKPKRATYCSFMSSMANQHFAPGYLERQLTLTKTVFLSHLAYQLSTFSVHSLMRCVFLYPSQFSFSYLFPTFVLRFSLSFQLSSPFPCSLVPLALSSIYPLKTSSTALNGCMEKTKTMDHICRSLLSFVETT